MNIPRPLAIALWPLSFLYGLAMRFRAWLYNKGWLKQEKLNRPVISVGNITVGGTGKTPMVIWLAERLLGEGKRVAILSRGYRGAAGTSDEIELMRQRLHGRALFGVGADRYAEGRRLESVGVDVFILDDGFQHLRLAREMDIVLIDSTRPLQDESILPGGRLREPLSSLNRAHAVVLTRTEQSQVTTAAVQKIPASTIYPAATKLLGFRRLGAVNSLEPLRACIPGPHFAFCGIGNPGAFFANLERWGIELAGRRIFRDHHRYSNDEIAELERAADAAGATALITTEKDAHNVGQALSHRLPIEIAVVALEIRDELEFLRDLHRRLPVSVAAVAS
jgi:tetraacyldisaccharide 4'-kinase